MNEYLKGLEVTHPAAPGHRRAGPGTTPRTPGHGRERVSWSKNAVLEAIRIEDEESGWPWVMKSYPALFGKA